MQAIEATGRIDAEGNLSLDQPLPIQPTRVRVIVLIADEQDRNEQPSGQDAPLDPAVEGFRQGWQDAMTGNTISVEQLWMTLDAIS